MSEPLAGPGGTGEHEVIELCFPATGDLVVLARFTAATVATRSGFDIDEIEDLRLAVDELCVSLGPIEEYENVRFEFERSTDTVRIACAMERAKGSTHPGPTDSRASAWERTVDLSRQLLDALVDEHGQHERDGHVYAWMEKRASR